MIRTHNTSRIYVKIWCLITRIVAQNPPDSNHEPKLETGGSGLHNTIGLKSV